METHAKYSPSKLPALSACPCYASDPTPSPAAMRGTAVHAYLADIVRGKAVDIPPAQADLAHCVVAGRRLFEHYKERYPDAEWEAEVKVDTGIPECYGTADAVGIDGLADRAIVIDWKTGRGEREDASRNLQPAAYALGVLQAYPHLVEVVCVMGETEQEASETVFTAAHLHALRQVIVGTIEHAKAKAYKSPSAKACRYCLHRTACDAVHAKVEEVAVAVPDSKPVSLSNEDLAQALAKFRPLAKVVASFIEGLEEEAKARLGQQADCLPGFALKASNGAKEWTLPEAEVLRLLRDWAANHGPGTAGSPAVTGLLSPAKVVGVLTEFLGSEKGAKKKAEEAIAGFSAPTKRLSLVSTAE